MDARQAVRSIDRLLDREQQRKLNDLESTIVLQIWAGSTYKSIGNRLSYETDYIKHVAAKLWRLLSRLLGESVCKGNIKSVLERYQSSVSVGSWHEPIDSDFGDRTVPDLQFSGTWTISDRCHSIVFFESGASTQSAQLMTIDALRDPLSIKDRSQNHQASSPQRNLQIEIQSSILQSLDVSMDSKVFTNNIFSILKEMDTKENAINCLIINYYS
jgi:hypothetical protein